MSINDTFHNICIVHDVFGGRVNEVIFRHLIKEREDIFTVDDCGNITHIANFAVRPQTITATEGGKVIASEEFYDGLQLDLEDYLIGEQITELWRLSEARQLRGNIR